MKLPLIIAGAFILITSACKTTYKATDNPMPVKDSADAKTDTTAGTINKMSTDTTMLSETDSSRMDSVKQAIPDSALIKSSTDSVQAKPVNDPAMTKAITHPASDPGIADSTKMEATPDSSDKNSVAPAAAEPAFIKQYPGATNVVWSAYDSLAAIPIDMRLTGWKKLDADDHMVKFDYKDETYYAWYDSDGKWIGSAATMADISTLPAAVSTAIKNAIKTRYTGYTISQVNREFQTGKKSYEVELTKDDSKVRMLVNSAGKITQIFKYAAASKE